MTWRRLLTKKRLAVLVGLLALYGSLWFITLRYGVPQVNRSAVEAMRVPSSYTDISDGRVATGGVYYCRSRVYAPLLVHTEYGWHGGPLYGDGGRAIYLWLGGASFRVQELEHWME